MRLTKSGAIGAILATIGLAAISSVAEAQKPDAAPTITMPDYNLPDNDTTIPPGGKFPQVSSILPFKVDGLKDNDVHASAAAKSKILFENQQRYDMFSWQTFIALNWPADTSKANYGKADQKKSIGDDGDRVWETFIPPELVFKDWGVHPEAYVPPVRREKKLRSITKRTHLLNEVDEAFFDEEKPLPPILDLRNNYVRFEIGLNKPEYDYIVTGATVGDMKYPLFNLELQKQFIAVKGNSDIDFPASDSSRGKYGSIEIKAAWKKIEPADTNRFYTQIVDVEEPNTPNKTKLKNQLYGLVGLHIMYKAEDSKGNPIPQWVWPTFEHIDNAPISDLRKASYPKGTTPEVAEWEWEWENRVWTRQPLPMKRKYNFFDPERDANPLKTSIGGYSPKSRAAMDAMNAFYGNSGPGNYFQPEQQFLSPPRTPSQIAKVITDNNAIVASQWTYALNNAMQEKLKGTVWANYRLVTTQRPTQPNLPSDSTSSATIKAGNPAPVSMANAVLETYMQINGSCMNCHAGASFGPGPVKNQFDANFSFMLQRAKTTGK